MSKKHTRAPVCYWGALIFIIAAFLCSVFWRSKTWSVGRIQVSCVGFALAMAVMAGLGYWMHRRIYLELTDRISSCVDDLIAGKEPQINREEERISSKLAAKLEALAEITRHTVEESNGKKAEVQQIISDISHQLKTPIANILMYSDTIRDCELPREEQVKFLEILHQQVRKLEFLVQALIKMSRLESSLIVLKKSEGDLYHTLARAVAAVTLSAQEKNLTIKAECREGIRLWYDPKWTEEAVFNVLDNAVKYTPEGGTITLLVRQWQIYTKISIRDTGIGIDPKHRNDIFKRFYRENKVHEVKGIGVGLYLTRKIISLQGGYVSVRSKPGEGAEFSLFLPNDQR
ncbi:sensor histidine kinase [Lactonifactor longoviformis]|uniref:sensor histidine kinase n=1 Tax=Lactonifactor longoviformis TaxID=341220 RepID=UPI0036F29C7C